MHAACARTNKIDRSRTPADPPTRASESPPLCIGDAPACAVAAADVGTSLPAPPWCTHARTRPGGGGSVDRDVHSADARSTESTHGRKDASVVDRAGWWWWPWPLSVRSFYWRPRPMLGSPVVYVMMMEMSIFMRIQSGVSCMHANLVKIVANACMIRTQRVHQEQTAEQKKVWTVVSQDQCADDPRRGRRSTS
jgi:hypothetical protein